MPEARAPTASNTTFDEQAAAYDARAGMPERAKTAIARAIVSRSGVGADDLLVELGAGTGEIGLPLACLPIRYVGLDASVAMLRQFRAKAAGRTPSLILADCDRAWPLRHGVAAVVFASRVIHLLDPEHVMREVLRVGRPASHLMLGRVLREPDGIKERLRRRRQGFLAEAGITPREGTAGTRRVVALCQNAGAQPLGRWVVAEWTGETSPEEILAGWESLSRMGSIPVDPVTRDGIVAEVRSWARGELGDLHRPEPFRERYAIDVVRLPSPPRVAAIAERLWKTKS